jgi:hypothetical protein
VADELDVLRQFRDETPGPSTDAWLRARSAIAAVLAEEGQAGGPAARRRLQLARPRSLHRPAWLRLPSVAAAAAGVAAVGVLAAVLVSSSAQTGDQVETTAYLTRVENALAAGQQDFIGYSRTVYSAPVYAEPVPGALLTLRDATVGPGLGPRWAISAAARWSYRGEARFTALSAAGQQLFSWKITAGNGDSLTTTVLYANSTWWRATSSLPAVVQQPARASCGGLGIAIGNGGWPAFITHQLQCGAYAVAGRQWVDGVDTVKIAGLPGAALQTLWVDPQTYLPVRVISAHGQTNFRWLTPTPTLLAELNLTVPHHYREVRPPS